MYLRLLAFFLTILIPACASSSPAFCMMYSTYKLNKQGDNVQPWCTPFPTGEGNGKPLKCSCLENPMNSMKRQKDRTLKDELPRSVDAQYATGEEWRNNSRKNEEIELKQKQRPVVDVTGDGSEVRCWKEQYCIGTWNVRSTNQGKLEVVK